MNFVAERWPPWRQGMEFDAGLLFICYQRDPRTGFIKIFDTMAKFDMLNQFVTHVGGGLFALPGGVAAGPATSGRRCSKRPDLRPSLARRRLAGISAKDAGETPADRRGVT